MRNIDLYSSGGRGLLGGQIARIPSYAAKPYDIITPASARYTFGADMIRALTAKAEKDKEDKIRTDMLAAMVGPGYEYDPSKASESFTPSPLMKSHRVALANAQAQAQPEGVSALGLQPSDTPFASGPYVQGGELEPVTQMSGGPLTGVLNDFEREAEREAASTQFEMDRGIRALGSEALAPPQFESTEFTPELTPQPNLGDDAAMRAALIGDVATPEEELAAYAGSPEERAAQERAYTATVNTPDAVAARMAEAVRLNPDIAKDPAYAQFVQSNLARKQAELDAAIERERAKAIRGEEFVQALAVAEAGRAPVGITKGISPSSKYDSGYAHINLRTGEDLGEAPAPSTHYNPEEQLLEEKFGGRGDSYTEAKEQREEADKMLGAISQMTYLAGQTNTGALAEWKLTAKKLAVAFGFDYDATEIATAEAMKSKGMDFVLMLIGKTKGAISNQEMAAFKEASAGLENTPLGNKMILDLSRKVAERMRAEADAVRALYGSDPEAGRYELDQAKFAVRDAFGPLYTDPRAEPPKSFVIDGKPGTKAEFYALPKEDQDFLRRGF